MNKKELIDWVAEETKTPKIQVEKLINATLAGIQRGTKSDGSVSLIGFGTFKATPRNAREGRNPKTGEKMQISATISPTFSAGKAFKECLQS